MYAMYHPDLHAESDPSNVKIVYKYFQVVLSPEEALVTPGSEFSGLEFFFFAWSKMERIQKQCLIK